MKEWEGQIKRLPRVTFKDWEDDAWDLVISRWIESIRCFEENGVLSDIEGERVTGFFGSEVQDLLSNPYNLFGGLPKIVEGSLDINRCGEERTAWGFVIEDGITISLYAQKVVDGLYAFRCSLDERRSRHEEWLGFVSQEEIDDLARFIEVRQETDLGDGVID